MKDLNQLKNQLGKQTENLESKVNQLWDQFTPHYTNLEPWQRGIVLIALMVLLIFITYYLTHESQDQKLKHKQKTEQALEEKFLKRMEILKKLRE